MTVYIKNEYGLVYRGLFNYLLGITSPSLNYIYAPSSFDKVVDHIMEDKDVDKIVILIDKRRV